MPFTVKYALPALGFICLAGCASLAKSEMGAAALYPSITKPDPEYTLDMAALRNDKRVIRAMQKIVTDREFNNDLLIELNEIPAPPFGEEKRAKRLKSILKAEGLKDVFIIISSKLIALKVLFYMKLKVFNQ